MDRDYLKEAVEATKTLLIDELQKNNFCKCRRIGEALILLVEIQSLQGSAPGQLTGVVE